MRRRDVGAPHLRSKQASKCAGGRVGGWVGCGRENGRAGGWSMRVGRAGWLAPSPRALPPRSQPLASHMPRLVAKITMGARLLSSARLR